MLMLQLGFAQANTDIKEMGVDYAKEKFIAMLKCTYEDSKFIVGYGRVLVYFGAFNIHYES